MTTDMVDIEYTEALLKNMEKFPDFAIIYSIHGNLVLIHRIVHGSLIKG